MAMILKETTYILVPKKRLGKNSHSCSLKKLGSSVVSGKPNSDYRYLYSSLDYYFKRTNVHFSVSAQETPGENIPTDLQLEKAKLLCRFRQAKQ